MTCREEILSCIEQFRRQTGHSEFSVQEIVERMQADGTTYKESTIRTHITSRLCANAPDNHATVYNDLERVDQGIYRLTA